MTAVHVLTQEDDYGALVRCFQAHPTLEWVPIAGDGFCMFAVVWHVLMPLDDDPARNPFFLSFIKRVAIRALELLEARDEGEMTRADRAEYVRIWKLLKESPVRVKGNWESPALDYAWPAIVDCLNSSSNDSFRIRIYSLNANRTGVVQIQTFPEMPRHNDDDDDVSHTICVLRWNDVVPHYDLLNTRM